MNYTPDHPPTQAAAAAAYYGYEEQRAVEPYGSGYGYNFQPAAFETSSHSHHSYHHHHHNNDEDMVRPKLSRETPPCFASPCMSRKQKRGICRRGGACHSDLLKSAVLACMSSQHTATSTEWEQEQHMPGDDDMMTMDEDDASTSWSSSQHTVPELHLPLPPPQQSPRKRVRRKGMAVADEEGSSDQEELAITHASNLLESLCSINPPMMSSLSLSLSSGRGAIARNSSSSKSSTGSSAAGAARAGEDGAPSRRQAPVRRVSRRTSYESVISGCNSEDFDEDLM